MSYKFFINVESLVMKVGWKKDGESFLWRDNKPFEDCTLMLKIGKEKGIGKGEEMEKSMTPSAKGWLPIKEQWRPSKAMLWLLKSSSKNLNLA